MLARVSLKVGFGIRSFNKFGLGSGLYRILKLSRIVKKTLEILFVEVSEIGAVVATIL
jgi:hypothetical protein